jgi:SAM-dependent methyltransferase
VTSEAADEPSIWRGRAAAKRERPAAVRDGRGGLLEVSSTNATPARDENVTVSGFLYYRDTKLRLITHPRNGGDQMLNFRSTLQSFKGWPAFLPINPASKNQSENMVKVSNERTYFSTNVLDSYTTYELMRAEALVLLKYQPSFAERDVLDIGVGTGRTTVYLAPLAKHYIGIDFSPVFIDFVNKAMPHIQAQLGDMRDLSDFGAEEFDFVMASFNVIDVVAHNDRIKTLREVHRVLRPGGIFIFSSHNLTYELAGYAPKLKFSRNAIRQVSLMFQWFVQLMNHAKIKKHRVFGEDYAILNDEGHDFSTLHYYIDHVSQRRQIGEHNFTVLGVYDICGDALAPQAIDRSSPFLMYVVQKPSSG